MPLMVCVLCVLAIAYRYYSAFLAAKVAALDDSRITPAVAHEDGENYEPTNKWVLFGHHFAAISGAGPLIGPVLAAQFGYMPGILWIVIGVCLGGAAQDFLVLAASIRRDGKSLAQIARQDVGKWAGGAAATAILFILIIALAGLGKVIVKALGGEEVHYPVGSRLVLTSMNELPQKHADEAHVYQVGPGSTLEWNKGQNTNRFQESFLLKSAAPLIPENGAIVLRAPNPANPKEAQACAGDVGQRVGNLHHCLHDSDRAVRRLLYVPSPQGPGGGSIDHRRDFDIGCGVCRQLGFTPALGKRL